MDRESAEKLFSMADLPTLSQQDVFFLDNVFKAEEFVSAIENLNRSSPGEDSLDYSFYQTFKHQTASLLCYYANYARERGFFSPRATEGLTQFIPKKNTDPRYPKNNRPIALLNVYYKVITSVVTKRLNRVIGKLVSLARKAVIGRLIHHNLFTLSNHSICKTNLYGNTRHKP